MHTKSANRSHLVETADDLTSLRTGVHNLSAIYWLNFDTLISKVNRMLGLRQSAIGTIIADCYNCR